MSTHNIPFFNMKKKNTLSQTCSYGNFSKGLKKEFETAVVNEPSVFEPLKFYCTVLTFGFFGMMNINTAVVRSSLSAG